ncbi:DUF4142 domain-containing protein [Nonomuraea sp. K274]|uniref:DUF4142 domain-containing protein n=1 Tax=Nonomuraea cypriaca TaxID=1187855 RepID=A0A931A4T5_9ACTN|nr:DUF4142 domain-containing protein [Nonomuraea cypriaca]MBF8185128.1 DUF4142 domain-containing protein [Nonomuraea cypriaca]
MRARLTMSLAALAVAVLPGCAGETPPQGEAVAARTDTQPSEQDRAWMRAIHEGNLAEVQAGRLAEDKGAARRIKLIGKMLVEDHTELDVKVTKAASQLGIQLPTSPSAEQRAEIVRLHDAVGRDFDQDFTAAMMKEHTTALAATRKQIADGSSPVVVSLARAAAPVLQQHLDALHEGHGE